MRFVTRIRNYHFEFLNIPRIIISPLPLFVIQIFFPRILSADMIKNDPLFQIIHPYFIRIIQTGYNIERVNVSSIIKLTHADDLFPLSPIQLSALRSFHNLPLPLFIPSSPLPPFYFYFYRYRTRMRLDKIDRETRHVSIVYVFHKA